MPPAFNPFEDRLARDIRNDLSESLLTVIASRSIEPAKDIAATYLGQEPGQPYRSYITDRLQRYEQILSRLDDSMNIIATAAVLWDLELFFEVHEILEPEGMKAAGERKLILQSLIRAAGVYIYLQLGYSERAAKIAGKTLPVLTRFGEKLRPDLDIDALIAAVAALSPEPPRLSR